jgi:hypothetical protein
MKPIAGNSGSTFAIRGGRAQHTPDLNRQQLMDGQTKTAAVSRSGFSKSNNNYAMNRPLINTGST